MARRNPVAVVGQYHRSLTLPCISTNASLQTSRLFSTTPRCRKNGPVPLLTPPSTATPELINLLSTIRSRIFLPSHLGQAQRRLIFRRQHWSILRNEPIAIEIGDESHTLEPIDRTKDVPDSWKSLVKVIDLLGSTTLQEGSGEARRYFTTIFVELLHGFRTAGRRWKSWQIEYLIRKAGNMGMASAVIQAARMGKDTGVLLREVRVVREMLWACRALWVNGADAAQALKFAEQIAELCEEKEHAAGVVKAKGTTDKDPRRQPDCIGVLLELAATNALQPDSSTETSKVETYVERLLINLESRLGTEMDEAERTLQESGRVAAAADYELCRWLPAMNGLEMAIQILGDKMPNTELANEQLQTLKDKVTAAKSLVAASQDPARGNRRGFSWAQTVEV